MRTLLLAAAMSAIAAAADPDGSIAEAGRWTHPRGPASMCGRSRDAGPDSFGSLRWRWKSPGTILSAPLVWDGTAFLLSSTGKTAVLDAIDIADGSAISTAHLAAATVSDPAAWNRSVYLVEDNRRLVGYRLRGAQFQRHLVHEGTFLSSPCIESGEIYVTSGEGLLRLGIGAKGPVWTAPGVMFGRPSLYGAHVYALEERDKKIRLVAFDRATGKPAAECIVSAGTAGTRFGEIVVAEGIAAVRLPPQRENRWRLVRRGQKDAALALTFDREEKLLTEPLVAHTFLLGVNEAIGITVFALADPKMRPIAARDQRPLLVNGAAAPTSMNGVVCFGSCAIDFNSMEVLWALGERKEGAPLASGLRFGPVPGGDSLALLVPADGKSLYALAPEVIGS